jgi:4,5-dihydroxyphthalate decarboxylase
MLPINHMMAIDTKLCQERPDVVREIYSVLQQSKAMAPNKSGAIDLTPFGIEPNRRALEVLIRNSYEQGLIPRAYSVDELFEEFNRLMS